MSAPTANSALLSTTHSASVRPSVSPLAMVRSLTANRDLILQMTKREVVGRYRGSVLGLLWSFFNPLVMLAVYTFAFSYIFKVRLNNRMNPGEHEAMTDFAIFAFTGLMLFTLFAETLNRAPTLIQANINYVKKVIFPLEVLPWVAMFSALVHTLISMLVLLLANLVFRHELHWTIVLFPLVLIPFMLLTIGLAWVLASLGVYLRDIAQTIVIITQILIYLAPVFYPLEVIKSAKIQFLIRWNPLTVPIESLRALLLRGEIPPLLPWAIYTGISLTVAYLGFIWFMRTKRGFADVL